MDQINQHLLAFEIACQKAGLKVTHQRQEIYRALLTASDHPSAEMLYQRLRENLPTISIDTIYRTLTTLANHGLINRVVTVESLNRFEIIRTPHHHLICSHCNMITDFAWPHFDQLPLPGKTQSWGEKISATVIVYGTCKACLQVK